MPEPTLRQSLELLRFGPAVQERMLEQFYVAKLDAYRSTLSGLRQLYGGKARVYLSTEIRDALLDEAERDAASVVRTFNGLLEAEAKRSPLKGQALFDHLAAYANERARKRAPMIARSEVGTARLDATVSFFRENGIEPGFDFVGPKPKCPICTALKATNPHTIGEVLAIGIPHIQCSHQWKGRVYSAAKLKAGGLRPGKISAGAGTVAGIVGGEALRSKLAGLSEETIAEAIRSGELVDAVR